jgi:hypothetical protein
MQRPADLHCPFPGWTPRFSCFPAKQNEGRFRLQPSNMRRIHFTTLVELVLPSKPCRRHCLPRNRSTGLSLGTL